MENIQNNKNNKNNENNENNEKNEKNEKNRNTKETKLTLECKKENIEEVKKLINKGLDINKKNDDGDTPLIIACKNNNKDLVECLLMDNRIDINKKSDYGINPLMVTCYFKNKEIMDYLLDHDADINVHDNKNNSPLHIASYLNSTETIDEKIDSLINKKKFLIEEKNKYNETPISIAEKLKNKAIKNKLKKILKFFNGKKSEVDYQDSEDNEMYFSKKSLKSPNIMINSICLINDNNNGNGTGFFIKIPIPSKEYPMYGLMTCNHVLNEKMLESDKSFKIRMPRNNERDIEIHINNKNFIFTSELLDVTFIELNLEEIVEIKPHFLKPSNNDAKKGESILILQYPKGKLSIAHDKIESIHSFNYYHKVSTDKGSSGSPLLNNKYEVVGVHKRSYKKQDVNVATKYIKIEIAIRKIYNDKYINGIERAKQSAKSLNENEIKILKERGLKLKLSSKDVEDTKNKINNEEKYNDFEKLNKIHELDILTKSLFYYDSLSKNKLLFYRTNYAWYVTILSEENKIKKYSLDSIKKLNWYPLKPCSQELDENIEDKIDGQEYVLITWLKLTELRYL